MATLSVEARNAAVDAIAGLCDDGSVRFLTVGHSEVATVGFDDPAFNAASSGTAAAKAMTPDTDATGGTIEYAKMLKSDGTSEVFSNLTCGTADTDIILSSLAIGAGDTLNITALTITQPAS